MSDQYEQVRSLSFPALAAALGLDISDYKQRKHGQEWYGACPVHRPKQNSTSFSYNQSGAYFCFSCNAKGRGALDLTKAVKACGFKEAVAFLEPFVGQSAQTPAPTEKTPLGGSGEAAEAKSMQDSLQPMQKDTWRKFAVSCPWLEARIPDAKVRELYGTFCYNNPARRSAYSGRVMIPIKATDGVLYGYLGRATDSSNEPKYLFPKNLPKSRFLFGAHELVSGNSGQTPLRVVYLVESPFCVMKFASLGLPAVAAYGWSVSEDQISLLHTICKGLVFLPDRNKNEEAAAQCARIARTLWVRFPPLPDGCEDPESLTLQQIQALTH